MAVTKLQEVLGANVRAYRERLDVSQEELAERSGLHRTYLSGVERGVRNPTVSIIDKLAKALQVTPDKLLVGHTMPKQAR